MYEKTVASRRYIRRFMPMMGAYIALLFLTEWIVARYSPAGLSLYALALLLAAPLIGIIVIIGLYLKEESDEYVRMQSVRMILFATGLTLAVTTVWGFLTSLAAVASLPLQFVGPLWCIGLAFGNVWVQRT